MISDKVPNQFRIEFDFIDVCVYGLTDILLQPLIEFSDVGVDARPSLIEPRPVPSDKFKKREATLFGVLLAKPAPERLFLNPDIELCHDQVDIVDKGELLFKMIAKVSAQLHLSDIPFAFL